MNMHSKWCGIGRNGCLQMFMIIIVWCIKKSVSPVELQMGILLPFISTICGPLVRGLFLTRPSVINLFWINVAVSGVGKTQSWKRMVLEPLKFILNNTDHAVEDFKVSKYTRAGNYIYIIRISSIVKYWAVIKFIIILCDKFINVGIEDKIIRGYCCVVTDEGTGFFDDLKKKESKHKSDLSLLNQLYDGEGDKTTLHKIGRVVPQNSTSISVSLQQEAFITGLTNLGKTLWLDSGFRERFLVMAVKPYK